ncbi:MAG: hypothetical protein JOZ47_00365 [Kutzneria sp.]|nr:hypothetical protein [Kutzneria sp.]
MADSPKWDDVKKLLDDPNVPDDQKKALVLAYASTSDGQNSWGLAPREELDPYRDKYGVSWGDVTGHSFSSGDVDQDATDAYNKAKESADKGRKQHDEDVNNGKHGLDDAANRAQDGGTGVGKSDDLLDMGKAGLRFFDNFLPLYGKLPDVVVKSPPQGVTMTSDFMHQRYDEHRGIDFTHFDDDVKELHAAAKTERDQHEQMANKLGGLWSHWSGGASRRSQESFAKFAKGVDRITQTLDDTAGVSRAAMHNISEAIRTKARWLLDNDADSDSYDGKTPDQIEVIISCAGGNASIGELKQAASYVNVQLDDGACDDDTYRQKVPVESIRWLNTFAKATEGRCDAFIKACDSTKTTVDQGFKALTDQLAKVTGDPFTDPAQPAAPQQPHSAGGGAGGGGGAPAGRGAPSGGGGIPGGGGAPSIPEMPKPVMPAAAQLPDPAHGDPRSAGHPESVTITEGDRAIQVESPDGQGHLKIQVDDGSGGPGKSYDVDFDAPGTVGDQPVTAPGQPTAVHAGADGRSVIQDGALTITAERSGATSGEVEVTVDDGSGKHSYTIDSADPSSTTPGHAPSMAVSAHQPDAGTGRSAGMWTLPESHVPAQSASPQPEMAWPDDTRSNGGQWMSPEEMSAAFNSPQDTTSPDFTDSPSFESASAGHPATTSLAATGLNTGVVSDSGTASWDAMTSGPGHAMSGAGAAPQDGRHATAWDMAHEAVAADHADGSYARTAAAGDAGLAALSDSDTHAAQATGGAGLGMTGGMPMMAGQGGGQGGDYERSGSSAWRTLGGTLFDTDESGLFSRISGVLSGKDDEVSQ